jgi:hypothetical protein
MEGKLVAEILARIAKADGLDQAPTQRLQKLVSGLEQVIDGLGFCLSEDGDLLSQWRGCSTASLTMWLWFLQSLIAVVTQVG